MKLTLACIVVFIVSITVTYGQTGTVRELVFQDRAILKYYDLKLALQQAADSAKLSNSQLPLTPSRIVNPGGSVAERDVTNRFLNAVKAADDSVKNVTGEITFTFNHQQYDCFIADPEKHAIQMHWKSVPGNTAYKRLGAVKKDLEKKGVPVAMLTNAGMYLENNIPQGLFIAERTELRPIDSDSNKYGNFYLKPNGIFYVKEKSASIATTESFSKYTAMQRTDILFATQSGPMLVVDGNIHPKFKHHSQNLNLRSGVGIRADGKLVFIISRSNKTNFHDFAVLFKDLLGCQNALFLDGAISRMYLNELRKDDLGGNFGGIISVTPVLK